MPGESSQASPEGRPAPLAPAAATETVAKFRTIIDSPVGRLALTATRDHLLAIDFVSGIGCPVATPREPLLLESARQLARYFSDPYFSFSLPLKLNGTPYLERIWDALLRIPAGQTETYGSLALRVGGSARSIGLACRSNPIPIVIPCHRVRGVRGLVGYCGQGSGSGLEIKRWLLAHEAGHIT